MVPVVLPLLHGAQGARRGPPADQALESDPPSCPASAEALRTGRPDLPQAAAAGAFALGLRQPQNLKRPRRAARCAAVTEVAGTLPGAIRCCGMSNSSSS